MNKQSGFSLIEITFGLLISSILSVMLFQVNGTLSRLSQSIESSLGYIRTVPLLMHQLERDLSAAYVPKPIYEAITHEWKTKKPGQPQAEVDTKEKEASGKNNQIGSAVEKKEDDTKKDPLEKWKAVEPFFCKAEDGEGLTISVITTSALPSFQFTVPRLVKVVYQVRPGSEDPDTFEIVRSEFADVFGQDEESSNKKNPALLVSGISSLKVRLFGQAKPVEEEKKTADLQDAQKDVGGVAEEKKPAPPTETSGWSKAEALEQFAGLVPLRLEFEGVVRTGPGDRSYPFIFSIPVHAAYDSMVMLKELRKKEPKEQKKADEKTAEKESAGMADAANKKAS